MARESAVLVFLGTEVVHIWFVIYFTRDFTLVIPVISRPILRD